jgi:hypothetical protein
MSNYKVSLCKGKVQEEFEDSKEVIRIRKSKKEYDQTSFIKLHISHHSSPAHRKLYK